MVVGGCALLSAAAWLFGFFHVGYGYYWRDFWFHLITFVVPVALVAFALWVLLHAHWWRRLVGAVLLLAAAAVWVLYLLLAANAFRIH